MITPLSTPGQWYLDFLNNGFWSALQSAGFSWWMLIIPWLSLPASLLLPQQFLSQKLIKITSAPSCLFRDAGRFV